MALCRMRKEKMENDILSTLEGTVKRILVKENDVVGTNEPLIEFE